MTNVMFQWFYMPEEVYSTDGTGGQGPGPQGPGTRAVDAINSCIFSSWVSATNFEISTSKVFDTSFTSSYNEVVLGHKNIVSCEVFTFTVLFQW